MKRCPYCGVELIETENGLLCPNHGIIEEEQEVNNETPNYIRG